MILTCVIIEDEIRAKEVLERYIAKVDNLKLIGYCRDGLEALTMLPKLQPDIIFLDINMPNLNGLEMLNIIQTKPDVIITTAYSDYALESYDFEVVDYLLKPIEFSKFLRSISRVENKRNTSNNTTGKTKESVDISDEGYALFKSGSKIHKVFFREIMYLEKDGNYLEIVLDNGKKVLIRSNMSNVFKLIPEKHFQRVHKSFVVNLNKVKVIEVNKLTLTGQIKIPLGNSYRQALSSRMEGLGNT